MLPSLKKLQKQVKLSLIAFFTKKASHYVAYWQFALN
jgi:hypothetical protein